MGHYTEVFFRAHLKHDTPPELIDWFDRLANSEDLPKPYDDSPFFDEHGTWEFMFFSGGAVYQISRPVQFRRSQRSYENHEVICHASAKYVPIDEFVEWIRPWLSHLPGDFLGYSLYEDSRPDGYYDKGPDQERPRLIFMPEVKS